MENRIQESGENYLETILLLSKELPLVRAIDLADAMAFTKPSVSRAIHILEDKGLLTIGSDGGLLLTKEGLARAEAVYERHRVIRNFLEEILGVSAKSAEEDACRMEHVICEETFDRIKDFLNANRNISN